LTLTGLLEQSGFAVYTREQLPQENNLGDRSEEMQASPYLKRSAAAYRSALQVSTREQLPQGWAMVENNLGAVLDDLGDRSEGTQAVGYLKQSAAAYRSALHVRAREQLPQDCGDDQEQPGSCTQ
jgi:hypothetical protein